MCIGSIPPNVQGASRPPRGLLRVSLRRNGASDSIFPRPCTDDSGDIFSLTWWDSASSSKRIPLDGHVVYEIRSRRGDLASWLAEAPSRQALEVSVAPGAGGGSKPAELSGFVPLSSLIERLSTSDDANFRLAEVVVVLKPRTDSPNSPLGGEMTPMSASQQMELSMTIDVSFDEGLVDVEGGHPAGTQLDAGSPGKERADEARAPTSSPSHDETCSRHTSLVLGRDSLDDVSSEPGWPLDARRMDVRVSYVCFDQAHAPLCVNDRKTVYLTLATQQDGKDQQRTSDVAYEAKEKPSACVPPGLQTKVMRASWKNEVITFDPLNLENCVDSVSGGSAGERKGAGASSDQGDELRKSTDSHHSSISSTFSPTSSTAKSPILRVGLWKTVGIVDQFQSFTVEGSSPSSLLIGSAVVVVTGALGEEEGIEIPLYDVELKKAGVVHLKIDTSSSKLENLESIHEHSRLNYEILSNMDALKRQVMPEEQHPGTRNVSRRYAVSVSSDDSGACLGVAYEGAVSDVDDDVGKDDSARKAAVLDDTGAAPGKGAERRRILQDDWIFNIEKSVG